MEIILSNASSRPIYEQITEQIKTAIMRGELKAGDPLPSMRVLAQDLKISVITTKRAYNDLEAGGYICTVGGKGCFVSNVDPNLFREGNLIEIEKKIQQAVYLAKLSNVSSEELKDIIDVYYKGE